MLSATISLSAGSSSFSKVRPWSVLQEQSSFFPSCFEWFYPSLSHLVHPFSAVSGPTVARDLVLVVFKVKLVVIGQLWTVAHIKEQN